jgi:hypothetical protein
MSLVVLISIGLVFSGCITNANISKQFTSSNTGCFKKDIQILNETAEFNGMHTWTAKCKGKTYLCTYHSTAGSKCMEAVK